jgi:uncharacterized membrane protein YcaP (DUF421 family)
METVLRVVAIYVFLMAAFRVLGKRELSQLAPFELVMLLIISEIVQQAMVRNDFSLTNAMIGVSTLLVLVWISSTLTHLSPRFERATQGSPTLLVADGRYLEANMNRERVTPGEIASEMHRYGLSRLEEVCWAILETDGNITIIPREPGGVTRKVDESEQSA